MLSRLTTVAFPLLSATKKKNKNPADLQPGKVGMDYGKLRSPWKRLVCCPSQCQIQTGEENAALSRSRLPVKGNRMERGQREDGAGPGEAPEKPEKRQMFVGRIFPPDLEF